MVVIWNLVEVVRKLVDVIRNLLERHTAFCEATVILVVVGGLMQLVGDYKEFGGVIK